MTSDRFTLSFCRSRARVLMLRRSRPPFAGLWNGLGGKVKPDETDDASALREVWEEAGLIYPAMLADDALAEYHCRYEGSRLLSVERRLDGSRRLRYLAPTEPSRRRRTPPDG
jgi:8-oxo-dGTP pyrophosphatase MutT (NUDIX family)